MIKLLCILLVFLLLTACSPSNYLHRFVVLPESEHSGVIRPCERMKVKVESGWSIDIKSLHKIEEDILQLDSIRGKRKLSQEIKQYTGIIVEGTRYIHVRGTKRERLRYKFSLPSAAWNCGGGSDFWQVLYNPEKREFSKFRFNHFI